MIKLDIWVSAIVFAVLLALFPAPAAAGTLERNITVPSKVLGRSLSYSLYSPPNTGDASARFPVLYLLHGHSDDEKAWIEYGDIVPVLDRLIASGALRPLIVVMPSAGDSWYVDDVRPNGYGAVAKALTTDLIESFETTHPIAARCREARAIGGLSMGGYGAMINAFNRNDLFSAVISLSGSLFSEAPSDIEARRADYERIYEGVFGTPFNPHRFLQWNTFKQLERIPPGKPLPAIWLAVGDRDYPMIFSGTLRMHQELDKRGVPNELHVMPGEHDWKLWKVAIQPALVWLSARLDAGCGGPVGRRERCCN